MNIFVFPEEKPKVFLDERTKKKKSGLGLKNLNCYGMVLILVMATKTHQTM